MPEQMIYEVFPDVDNLWRWRLRAGNNRIIADSGESYENIADCMAGIKLVKSAGPAPVRRLNPNRRPRE